MQSSFSLLLVALLSYGAYAQKGTYQEIVPIVSKAQPVTPPHAIDESERRKECPAGFSFVGKQCAKTLTEEPRIICPAGTILVDGRCVTYLGKETECPPGYAPIHGICERKLTTAPEIACPAGFILRGKDTCVTTVPLGDKKICPAQTIPKGDACASTKIESPEYVCPGGYTLLDKRCQREETFDCTPARKIPEIPEGKKDAPLIRRAPVLSKGKEAHVYRLPVSEPLVEEYVIRKTCKRIITEGARPVCPKGGQFDGKSCVSDVLVAPVLKPGGYKEETAPILRICPAGFEEFGKECIAIEETLPITFCPASTIDLGDKCAIYSGPKTICPEGFFLEGKVCVRTIFAAPSVEFTVTYACTGKNCGQHH